MSYNENIVSLPCFRFHISFSIHFFCSCFRFHIYYSKKRVCKAGAGRENDEGQCNTPGFPLHDNFKIEVDHRKSRKLYVPRNHPRLTQSSTVMLQSWRGNCDLQLLIYNCHPDKLDVSEVSRVTDYIAAYSCKGNQTVREEKLQNEKIIMA